MTSFSTPDQIIQDLGGCGRYQTLISVVGHFVKFLFCWSGTTMLVISVTPPWWCDTIDPGNVTTHLDSDFMSNYTEYHVHKNYSTYDILNGTDTSKDVYFKACRTPKGRTCSRFRFDGHPTLVSEFDLVCDASYIPSLIMSLQSAGYLVGNLFSGHLSDRFGRKRPLFAAVFLVSVFNIVSFLSNHWTLFAATRFFVGFGISAYFATTYSLLSEFTLSQHRAWIIGFPSWSIETALYVGVAWLLKDWRYLQLAAAIIGVPCLLAWWYVFGS